MSQVGKVLTPAEVGKVFYVLSKQGYSVMNLLRVDHIEHVEARCVRVVLQTSDQRVFEAVINLTELSIVSIDPTFSFSSHMKERSELATLCASHPTFLKLLSTKKLKPDQLLMVPCAMETIPASNLPNGVTSNATSSSNSLKPSNLLRILFFPRDSGNDYSKVPAPIEDISPVFDAEKKSIMFVADSLNITTATISEAMSLIYKNELTSQEADHTMSQTIDFWRRHVNPGFLQYRKSVAQGADYASLDWYDPIPGSAVFNDHRGQTYLDLLGGFGIYNVGRRNPDVVAAVQAQLGKQALHSQELLDPLRAYAARIVSSLMPSDASRKLSHCFFVNSGTEAVEAALKAAFMATGRKLIIAALNAFHGKTLGALACTSKSAFRKPFLGVFSDVIHVGFNDVAALTHVFESSRFTGDEIAGVILEPIQGEGGVHVASNEYLQTARDLCDKFGACLIFDEVQTGMGRTGTWWGCSHSNVTPDIMAIGKAFGGGVMPAGACVATETVWKKYFENPFLFTTTFGGNPLAMAAAIATFSTIIKNNLLQAATDRGNQFRKGLDSLFKLYPKLIAEVRGRGLLIGIEFVNNEIGVEFSKGMFTRKMLVSGTLVNAKTIRVEPPLTITEEQVDAALVAMKEVLKEIFLAQQVQFSSKL